MTPTEPLEWPDYFPEDCPMPPHDCRPGTYIHLVSSSPTPPDCDFLPQVVDASGIKRGEGRGSACKNCALSVFVSEATARDFLSALGDNFRLRYLAVMEAKEDDGVIHPDEERTPGHFLWWIPKWPDGPSFKRFFRGCVDGA